MTDDDKLAEELARAMALDANDYEGPDLQWQCWCDSARAILPILHRERLAAAEAVREAAAIAYEVEAGTWKQLPQRGSVVRQGGRTIRALDLNAILGASHDQ